MKAQHDGGLGQRRGAHARTRQSPYNWRAEHNGILTGGVDVRALFEILKRWSAPTVAKPW